MNDQPSPGAPLDGNAAAGTLRELFAFDLTAAVGKCGGCGASRPMAETSMYGPAPGLVLRCPGCDHVLLRVVTSEQRTWLDLSGLRVVEVP
jgi:hypothetical protein